VCSMRWSAQRGMGGFVHLQQVMAGFVKQIPQGRGCIGSAILVINSIKQKNRKVESEFVTKFINVLQRLCLVL
jgi:hypothetical protein